ncbi:hypothetical protein F5141DRAFT_108930 [Pisolithus sp. B1]|nr:hypothetical protein F5141DRAFT_108930 [Pisolithus sp. B1]
MSPVLVARDDSSSSLGVSKGLYIAGFTLVGILVGGLSLWLLVRCYKKRMSAKRIDERGAAFLHVRGVKKTGDNVPDMRGGIPNAFSRENMTASIVLPDRVLLRQAYSAGPSSTPALFVQSQPISASDPPLQAPISPLNLAHFRLSRVSTHSTHSPVAHPSFMQSRTSSFSVGSAGSASSHSRPVRQLFEPVLPDELPLTRLGEYFAILESFDDGWCLVVRDNSRPRRSSITSAILALRGRNSNALSADAAEGTHLDIGLVPAWVFVKPMKGLTVERPMRVSSVDALKLGLGGAEPTRDTIVSWSHFA